MLEEGVGNPHARPHGHEHAGSGSLPHEIGKKKKKKSGA